MDLLNAFNKEQKEVISYIKSICEALNIKAYIVGGAVRDALINRALNDIDICITADPKIVIDSLENVSHYEYHNQFQTSTIYFNNGVNIDLIRCRKEIYIKDGALPEVTPSSIEDDLYRRDFTVNALAYSITESTIIDLFNGVVHLREKRLVSIHNRSYNEDPTRIFRAIKYSVRYNFKICDKKEIKFSLKEKTLGNISNDRIIKELYLICREENWIDNLKLCDELEILNIDIQKLGVHNPIVDFDDINIRILNLFYALNKEEDKEYFINNSFLYKDLKKDIVYYNNNKEKLVDLLTNTIDNYEIYNLFKTVGFYCLVLFAYDNNVKYKVFNYLYNLKDVSLKINGKDISSQGIKEGKLIGAILKHMLKLKVNIGLTKEKKYIVENLGEIIKCL